MKKVFLSLIGLWIGIHFAAIAGNTAQTSPFLTRQFPASTIKEVIAQTSGGSINVNGNASTDAIVEVLVEHKNWSQDKIKQVFDEYYSVEINAENDKLYVVAKSKKNIRNWSDAGLSISFKISVANQTGTDLSTSGGSILLRNLTGTQNFKTSGGSLTLENLSGNITGKTSGGSIDITDSNGKIELATSGGSVSAGNTSGTISLKTSGGSLNLSFLQGTIEAKTSGGSISANDITGQFSTATSGGNVYLTNIAGNLEATTAGGNMNVTMKSTNEYVQLKTSGNIRLTIPKGGYKLAVKAGNISTPVFENFSGTKDSNRIDGTIGNGKTSIELKSSQKVEISFN